MQVSAIKRPLTQTAVVMAAVGVACVSVGALVAAGAVHVTGDQQAAPFLGFAIALVPLLVLGATRWPVAVPFCLFAILAPLDKLTIAGVDSTAKFVGLLSGMTVALAILVRKRMIHPPLALAMWALLIAWMGLSLMWSQGYSTGIQRMIQIPSLFGVALVLAITRVSVRELRIVLTAAVLGGLVASLYGLSLFLKGALEVHDHGRIDLDQVDPNYFAGALILPTILAGMNVLRAKNMLIKLLSLGACLMPLVGILISGSRGAVVGLAGGLAYLVFRTRFRLQLGLLVAAMGLVSLSVPTIWQRFADPYESDASGRYEIWTAGLAAFRDYWLTGAGIGGWDSAYRVAYLRVNIHPLMNLWDRGSHNLLLEVAVELGIVGVILLGAALFAQFRCMRLIPRQDSLYDWRLAIEAATVSIIFDAFSLPNVLTLKYAWLVFYLGFIVRGAWVTRKLEEGSEPFAAGPATESRLRSRRVLA